MKAFANATLSAQVEGFGPDFRSPFALAPGATAKSIRLSIPSVHRLFALLTSLSMLHLMLVGSDLACATHSANGHGTMAMSARHATRSNVENASGDAVGEYIADHGSARPATDCATPTQTHCCEAMSSCGVTTTVTTREHLATRSTPASKTPQYEASTLVSVLTAPDPPPPKA